MGFIQRIEQQISGMRVFISGGSSGIGLAATRALTELGAQVAVCALNMREFTALPDAVDAYEVDVRSREQVDAAMKDFSLKYGGIDALINAAGVSLWKPFFDMDDEFWDLIYDVNVKGSFLCIQSAAQYMKQQQSGIIINIASMSGLKSGMPQASAYASSKWAIVGLSRNLHLELKEHGIRVACYCPGSTRTPLHEQAETADQDKMFDPDEIAESLVFMLSASEHGHVQLMAQPAMFEEWR